MIPITVHIKNTETNRIVGHPSGVEEDLDYRKGYSLWRWEEGNESCDCCRAVYMGEEHDIPCGEWKYRVKIVIDDTGEVIYNEWE